MTKPTKPITTADELVEYLFTNGAGDEGDRLRLYRCEQGDDMVYLETWYSNAVAAKVRELVKSVTCKHGIERELEAVNVVDGLLALMREDVGGWHYNVTDHAFSYLRRMKHAYPDIPLTVSVADELRRRESQP